MQRDDSNQLPEGEPAFVNTLESEESASSATAVESSDLNPHDGRELAQSIRFPSCGEQIYLELPKSSITNKDLCTITQCNTWDSWWSDPILDVALEILALRYSTAEHKIAIGSSIVGQVLFSIGKQHVSGTDYSQSLSEYKEMFASASWIFIPINDAYIETDTTTTQGSHWSLVAVDRNRDIAHYVDSLMVRDERYQIVAEWTAYGLGRLLDEEYDFNPEFETPHQWDHNRYNGHSGDDFGPCGPFVVTMVEQYVRNIIRKSVHGQADNIYLEIGDKYHDHFKQLFNSYDVRVRVALDMQEAKANREAQLLSAFDFDDDGLFATDPHASVEVVALVTPNDFAARALEGLESVNTDTTYVQYSDSESDSSTSSSDDDLIEDFQGLRPYEDQAEETTETVLGETEESESEVEEGENEVEDNNYYKVLNESEVEEIEQNWIA